MVQASKIQAAACPMRVEEYISFASKSGFFDESSPFPENDSRVQLEFLRLCREAFPGEAEPVIDVYAGYGFYRDTVDYERTGKAFALATPVIDGCIGVSAARLIGDMQALQNAVLEAGDVILTDSFSCTDGYDLSRSENIIRMNSPVADIAMPFAAYLDSLTSERRKKYRRLVLDFEAHTLDFNLGGDGLTSEEMEMIYSWLGAKWGEEAGYAFRQTLWAKAVQAFRPAQSFVMRVTDKGEPVFFQTMIVKYGHVYCQSIAKNEDKFYSGLAAYTDFKCIEAMCGKPEFHTFDPSCRTSLEDPESIGVAKRATVNRNCVKPLLAIGAAAGPLLFQTLQGKEA